jgi:hypothetical protein
MQHRLCVACMAAFAPPGHVKCEDCDCRNGHPKPAKRSEPPGLTADLARQLTQAGIDPNAAAAYLQP